MHQSTYDALVRQAEEAAARSPTSYRSWVAFFAGLGYLVVGSTLVLGLLLLAVAIAVCVYAIASHDGNGAVFKFAAVTGAFGLGLSGTMLKGLLGGFPPASGSELTRAQAPALFDEIERLRRALRVPAVHRVVLDQELNAALYQRPRLGIFGWYQNTLILGLPLLRQFTPDQARAVIAHELGHLRGEHGRFGARIYRLRLIWARMIERNGESKLFGTFLRWYVPRFNAYTFVLGRMQEREADHVSAELCSATAAGSALIRSAVIGRLHGRFWEHLPIVAAREPEAPGDVYTRLDRWLAATPPEATRWLGEALRRDSGSDDTHPCLRERLALIGYVRIGDVPPAPMPAASAAEHWLEDAAAHAAHDDAQWRAANAEAWRSQHAHGARLLARRDALAAQAGDQAMGIDERWELAALTHHFDGARAARGPLMVVVALAPTHAPALFRLGADLLDEGDARGVPLVEAAMVFDRDLVATGSGVLGDFAEAQGRR